MQASKTRSKYGNVPLDELKIKHIESMTEVILEVTAVADSSITCMDLADIAYDDIRGPIKTHKRLIRTAIENTTNTSRDVTITINGYTCSQWHHSFTDITELLTQAVTERLNDSALSDISITVTVGETHDINTLTGSELLKSLDTPSISL